MAQEEPQKEPSKALELVKPEQRMLMVQAADIGALIVKNGAPFLDLSQPAIVENFIVLAPSMIVQQVSPNFTPYVNVVQFSPSDSGVYPIDKKWNPRTRKEEAETVGLGKIQLMALASAMGGSLRSTNRIDAHGNRFSDAEFSIRRPDGTLEVWPGSRAWIKEDEYEKLVESCPTQKWTGSGDNRHQVDMTPAEREAWIKKNWIKAKENAYQMTETKAMERAIRAGGKIQTKFTVEELQKKRFAVLAVAYTPDVNNVNIQLALVEKGQQAIGAAFGPETTTIMHRPMIDEDDDEPGEGAMITDPTTGFQVDPVTGVVEGTCTEEPEDGEASAAPAATWQTFGEMPAVDPEIPAGNHKGKKLSEVTRIDPLYVLNTLARSQRPDGSPTEWSLPAEDWLKFYYGDEYETRAKAGEKVGNVDAITW